jgi:hypothetical protein
MQHAGDAVGDIAYECAGGNSGFNDEAMDKKIKRLKSRGVQDVTGALADDLYNEVDTLMDLMGDRICDLAGKDDKMFNAICDEIARLGHPAMKTAARKLRRK